MSDFRNMSSKLLVNGFIKKVLVILGCLLFLFSVVYPFYFMSMHSMEYWGVTYWSYKADVTEVTISRFSSQSWFFGYWSNANIFYIDGPWTSWILLAMFVIQTVALAFGCASLVANRRIILFVPVCLSLTVLALMSYVGYRLTSYYGYSSYYAGGYQLGYYLVYPSLAMFLFAFLLNEVTKNRQTTNRDILKRALIYLKKWQGNNMKTSYLQLIGIIGIIVGVLLLNSGIYAATYYTWLSPPVFPVAPVYPYAAYSGVLLGAGAALIFVGIAAVFLALRKKEISVIPPPPPSNAQRARAKMVSLNVAFALGIICIILVAGLGGAMAYYISTHHHTDSNYDSLTSQNTYLNNIVNLAYSTLWVSDTTVTQTAGNYTYWYFPASYAGYVSVNVQTSTTDTTYVEVIYTAYVGINYDNTIIVGTNGTATFPILPPALYAALPLSSIEIRVGNTNTVGNATETLTITYYY
jgi:hypothetical protein